MGFWSGLGKVLKVAAPVASMFVPGLQGVGLAAMLGRAGIGAATGAMGGGGAKGALLGGGLGAGAGYLAKGGSSIWGKLLHRGAQSGAEKFAMPGAVQAMNDPTGAAGRGGGFWNKVGDFVGGDGNSLIRAGMNASGNVAKGMSTGRDKELINTARQQEILKAAQHQAMVSALGKNVQDVSIAAPPGITMGTVTGGLRPSALGAEGRAAAAKGYDLSMDRLNHLPSAKAGVLENTLGTVGAVGAGINQAQTDNRTNSLVAQLLAKQQAQMEDGTEG
jgi:hypothetical protein